MYSVLSASSPFQPARHALWLAVAVVLATMAGCGGGGGGGGGEIVSTANARPSESNGSASAGGSNSSSGGSVTTPTLPSTPSGSNSSGNSNTADGDNAVVPTLPPAPTPIPTSPFTCDTGAITCIEVASTSAQTQASVPVTFGQPFKAGDWRHASQGLVAKVNGVAVPLQIDEVSSHRDGSARFAVLSAQLNNLAAGQSRIVNLYTGAKSTSAANVPANPDWNLEIEAQLFDTAGNATATLVALPQEQLRAQIASGSGRRIAGSVASEYTVTTALKDKATGAVHPHLTARLHIRLVDGGSRIRTDVVLENTRTFVANPGNFTYALTIKRKGVTLHSQPKFTHYHHARWHKVVWSGDTAEPRSRIRHHMPYFIASKAVQNYDLSVKVPESVLAQEATTLAQKRQEQAALGPMGNVFLNPYFPATGGRPEIGPLPRWTALYLVTQDDRALETMLANANASGAVPIHYRDEATDRPVDLIQLPNFTVYANQNSQPLLPVVSDKTIYDADTAHQGSFVYVPYLITGDQFYLDEILFWANYNVMSHPTAYREYEKTTINRQQVRGAAWGMRALAEAAWSLPDTHASKAYFEKILKNNIEAYDAIHATVIAKSLLGAIPHLSRDNEETGPWQNDFVGIVFSQLVDNGETGLRRTLDWFSKFNVGRFTNDQNGFCSARGVGYYWKIKMAPTDTQYINNWRDLFAKNYPEDSGVNCNTMVVNYGAPHLPAGSAAYARAMLAASANANVSDAQTGYQRWKSLTPLMDSTFATDPTWAIVPR